MNSITFYGGTPQQFTVFYEGNGFRIEYPENSALDDKERAVIHDHFSRLYLPAVVGVE
jgi:hypothetical protein